MGEFAWPFGLGIFAAFNPCGFAMLPAYLSYFLGIESKENDQRRLTTVARGLIVGLIMTMGFIAVFGTFGEESDRDFRRGAEIGRRPLPDQSVVPEERAPSGLPYVGGPTSS